MKPEQQRIAIAEFCGWKHVWRGSHAGILTGYSPEDGKERIPPDYLNDLNAMHEAEKFLTTSQPDYLERLKHLTSDPSVMWCGWKLLHATAAQRAEAFLRAIGKWIDSPPSTRTASIQEPAVIHLNEKPKEKKVKKARVVSDYIGLGLETDVDNDFGVVIKTKD